MIISTESSCFKYYQWLRSLYGCYGASATSLCPFFHTILWGSLALIPLCIPLFIGWIVMRVGRWMMKFEGRLIKIENRSQTLVDKMADKFLDLFAKTKFGKYLSQGPNKFEDSPLVSGIIYTMIGISMLAMVAGVILTVGALCTLLGMGVWNITSVLAWIWNTGASIMFFGGELALNFGWAVFWVLGSVGFVMQWAWSGVSGFFTNGELWGAIWSTALIIIVYISVISIACVALGYTGMLIARTKFSKRCWAGCVTKVNGLAAARVASKERVKAAQENLPDIKCTYCDTDNSAMQVLCTHCNKHLRGKKEYANYEAWGNLSPGQFAFIKGIHLIVRPIGYVVVSPISFIRSSLRRGSSEVHMLSWIGVVWETLKAIKHRACPIVEFMSPNEVQERARSGAEERNRMRQEERS